MKRSLRPPRLYAIADARVLGEVSIAEAVAIMAAAGVRWIQVRGKGLADDELFRQVEAAVRAVEGTGASLWVNDRADVAAMLGAAGLHLGQEDLPPAAARRVVGEEMWIGQSAHDEAELAAAVADPEVDVVAVGAVFATASKERPAPVVGLEFVRRARAATAKPLVAIGGIDAERAPAVLAAGADAVAVLSAICRGDIAANCRRLLAVVEEAR
ncbi:MAG: thiamine phosphate synthase [Thermoanaerobaculia bacterium]